MDTRKDRVIKPSEERPWERFYAPTTNCRLKEELHYNSLWRFLEQEMLADGDRHDALVYFGRRIKRSELIADVQLWARVLKGMGVEADEHVLIFSPFTPEVVSILFAINLVGATAILPNLAASHTALSGSMGSSRVAFVFDGLEQRISDILAREQFELVVLIDATRGMSCPLKQIAGTINWLKSFKVRHRSPKYISLDKAIHRYGPYQGEVEAPHKPGRVAIYSSSGGTTQKGQAKQIGLTNEGMLRMFTNSLAFNEQGHPFREGDIVYCNLPPFVCTALFVLLMVPLQHRMTCILEPRLDVDTFTKNLLKYRPQVTLIPGKCWEGFCTKMEEMAERGQLPDLSFLRLPIMGGEGCTPEMLEWMNKVLHRYGSTTGIVSGYGMSEAFSVITIDWRPGCHIAENKRPCISVGYPFPGFTVGIFGPDGQELPYGMRGELRTKTATIMKGYLNNEELTKATIGDGWIHSGDLCEMDEQGIVYIYGRMNDYVCSPKGEPIYLFDIANYLRQDHAVKHAMVCNMGHSTDDPHLAAHLILDEKVKETQIEVLSRLETSMKKILPQGLDIEGYKLHQGTFRMSIVCKVDHNSYHEELTGYLKPTPQGMEHVNFNSIN